MVMNRFSIQRLGVTLAIILVVVAVLVAGGYIISQILIPKPAPLPPGSNLVGGYLAVAVGRLAHEDSSGGIYAKDIDGKEIFLPGVEVYLEDPQNNKTSNLEKTDLSGRFTLSAPEPGRYRICWKSDVYGTDCTPVFVSAGTAPQFVSTVNVKVPQKNGYVAVMGHVTTADGSLPRMFDPLLNINAFATVGLDENNNRIADVYVNNFGDYLLPYVPIKQKIQVTASIESAKFTQEIWPEAQIEAAPLNQVNLKIENNRPRLDSLVAFDSVT